MSVHLVLRAVSKSYGDRLVLDRIDAAVRPRERVGIVGENGSGKSTLLRLIAGTEPPDDGEVTVLADGGVGHLRQEPAPAGDRTVGQAVDAALAELRAAERRLRALETNLTDDRMAEYAALLDAFEARGGYGADARVDRALHGLGLSHVDRSRPLSTLSGGERARLDLACVLAADPELLLLDEPTNHLDDPALAWLEERLRGHRGTVVVVSHDRVFLDRVVTAVLEVDDGRLTRFGGGYTGFLEAKAAARQRWEQEYAAWCQEVARVEEFAATTARRVAPGRPMRDRNKPAYDRAGGRVQQSVAGRVRAARERLRRLHDDPVPAPPAPLRIRGRFDGHGGRFDGHGGRFDGHGEGTLVELRGVRVGDRLGVPELTVGAGERLLVCGPNGAGKSTLLDVVAGRVEPDAGTVRRHGRVGHLPQEVTFDRPGRTVLDAFRAGRPGYADEQRAELLGLGLFRPDALDRPVAALSAGQRRRLALARLLVDSHDLLLLDEPTNHLSLTLVEELEEALGAYRGALVVVSHDRALRRRFAGRVLELRHGRIHAHTTG